MLANGYFNLRNWVSDLAEFCHAVEPLPEEERKKITLASSEEAKILGVCWRPAKDTLSFSVI